MKYNRLIRELFKCSCSKRNPNTSSFSVNKAATIKFFSTALHVEPKIRQESARKTSLYDVHLANKGKMVNFAGFLLPIQYEDDSIISSHLHTRANCSIFDVSHMLQTYVRGKHSIQFLESLCVTDIAGMRTNQSTLSLFTNSLGGIIDDIMITKISDNVLYLVSNASRQNIDKRLMLEKLNAFKSSGKDVHLEFLDATDQSLIAIQGPKTTSILQPLTDTDLDSLHFMRSAVVNVCGIANCRISRCGYTGEDGFEISVPSERVSGLVETLLQNKLVKLAGLGARDTLRLEAGLCLYGNDIDETTTPVNAGLSWTISKRRRIEKNFPGSGVIVKQLECGVAKKRVGIIKIGGPPARAGSKIIGFEDATIGHVTSGCPSPSLGINIAIGYVEMSYSKPKTEIRLKIRDNLYNATISKMPFRDAKYYVKAKNSLIV